MCYTHSYAQACPAQEREIQREGDAQTERELSTQTSYNRIILYTDMRVYSVIRSGPSIVSAAAATDVQHSNIRAASTAAGAEGERDEIE